MQGTLKRHPEVPLITSIDSLSAGSSWKLITSKPFQDQIVIFRQLAQNAIARAFQHTRLDPALFNDTIRIDCCFVLSSTGRARLAGVPMRKARSINYQAGLCKQSRRLPTLPRSFPRSTIGSNRLNFRVRDGNGCDPVDKITGKLVLCAWYFVLCSYPTARVQSTKLKSTKIKIE